MYPARAVWDGGSRGMQLKKKLRVPAPRHSCSCRLLALGPGGLDPCQPCLGTRMGETRGRETAPASAQKCLTFSVYVPWTSCTEGWKSLRDVSERQMEPSSPPVGAHHCSPPCLHSPCSVCQCCRAFTTNASVFPLDLEGKGQGSAPTVSPLRPCDHWASHVCITFNQTPLNPCGFVLPKGWCKAREGLTHGLLVVK